MPTTPTDYHELIRTAVASTIRTTLHDAGFEIIVHEMEDIEDLRAVDLPCIGVACVGPEQDRSEMSTNRQDGIGYPIGVLLFTSGVSNGEKTGFAPTATLFRRMIHTAFNNQRLTDIEQVGWCECSPDGVVLDKDSPAFQKLQTGVTVVAIGRFPRL
jgi:hypothetical protein